MRTKVVLAVLIAACAADIDAQRSGKGLATLAISVTDPTGAPLSGVKITLEGPTSRQARTERGRIAIEELPAGAYKLRFDLDGFIPLERELTARAGKPIDVNVTLTPTPKPPPPPAPPPAPEKPPVIKVDPARIDIGEFLEKNFVGRAAGKSSPLTCATGATAILLQMREPLDEHAHEDADEFAYVVAGEGTARVGGTDHPLKWGVLLMVPRTIPHSFTARGRNPLVIMSIKAGHPCN